MRRGPAAALRLTLNASRLRLFSLRSSRPSATFRIPETNFASGPLFFNQGRRPDFKAPAGFRPVAPRTRSRARDPEQARSSGGEHYLDTVGVSGSNPLEPTNFAPEGA